MSKRVRIAFTSIVLRTHDADSAQTVSAALKTYKKAALQAQPETGNVAVKVRFPNPDLRLRAHAVVRVNVVPQVIDATEHRKSLRSCWLRSARSFLAKAVSAKSGIPAPW